MRYMLTDELWAILEPLVQKARRYTCGHRPILSDRMFFEALLYVSRTAIPWRDLPAEFGRWDAVYNRFVRWVRSGNMQRLFELLTANPSLGNMRRILIDSTIVRAHQHAAGALRKKKKLEQHAVRRKRVLDAAVAV